MPRITPVHWKILECIFEKAGFVFKGQTGRHRRYSKPDCKRPIIIPTYKEVQLNNIHSNMRTAKMSREEYLRLLEKCK